MVNLNYTILFHSNTEQLARNKKTNGKKHERKDENKKKVYSQPLSNSLAILAKKASSSESNELLP